MRRRILTIFIMAIVLAAASAFAYAADTTLEIKAPDKLPAVGETFDVEVNLTGNPGVNVIEFQLVYDGSVLKCTGVKKGKILREMLSVVNPGYSDHAAFAGAATTEVVTGDGAVSTFTFKVLKEPATDLIFTFDKIRITDENGKAIPYKESTVRITVNGKDPVAPNPGSSGDNTGTSDDSGNAGSNSSDNSSVNGPSGSDSSGNNPSDSGSGQTDPGTPGIIDEVIDEVIVPGVDDTVDDVVNPKSPFEDTKRHWGEPYIAKAVQKGLFKGYDEKHFGPNDPVTRGQFMTVLYRMAGSPETSAKTPFKDISGEITEFQKAIAWGYEKKYVNGKTADRFAPASNVTRQEAMKMLFGYSGGQRGTEAMFTTTYDSQFADSGKVADWAKDAMYWGVYNTLISGTSDTTLEPGGTATRAQLAKILVVYTDKFGASDKGANE